MRRTIYITLLATLAMTACTDELFQVPITDKESSNFFKNEVEIEEAVNGVYSTLQFTGLYNLYIPALGEISSDDAFDEVPAKAQALLAKVLLTLKDYNGAKTQLQAIVSSGKHSLLAKPEDIFSVSNENNAEVIFSVQFASGINGNTEGSAAHQQFSPSGTVSGAKGHNLPSKQLVALYTAGDLRKNAYVGTTSIGFPFSKKLTKPSTSPADGASNFVVLRYADVLLMLAEVENELNNTSSAATYLNQVRKRAGLPDATASTQADLRAAIELERRLEFIGEGHRWFDLLRYGKAVEVMNEWFKSVGKLITINSNRLLMPIPQSQIDTDPAIKQNPGY